MHGAGVTVCVLCMCVHGAPLLLLRVVEREREENAHKKISSNSPCLFCFAFCGSVLVHACDGWSRDSGTDMAT
jgi:hypothetical protein